MEPRLTRGEYWILSAAVESRMPLGRLTLPNIREAFNRPGHGLSDRALSATVHRLFAEGLIAGKVFDRARCEGTCALTEVDLDAGAIDAALYERASLQQRVRYQTYYGLTEKGAQVWEAFAQPDWSLFIDGSTEIETRVTTTLCQSERTLRRYCIAHGAWSGVGLDEFQFDRVEPWEATYWKTLPFAHRARCVEPDGVGGVPSSLVSPRDDLGLSAAGWFRQLWCNRWL